MKLKFFKWSLVGVFAVCSTAWASEDLLQLLDSGKSQSLYNPQAQQKATEIRKLLGNPTAEQNIFLGFWADQNYEKALYQWPAAFAGTSLSESANGKALKAVLMYRNGLHLAGLLELTGLPNPQGRLSSIVVDEWTKALNENSFKAVDLLSAGSSTEFSFIFGKEIWAQVQSRRAFAARDLALVAELQKLVPPNSQEMAWLLWQELLIKMDQDPKQAAVVLGGLIKAENSAVSRDLLQMTAARLLYQNGLLDGAIDYYKKISKSSEHWFLAQEEMAWAYLRKGEPQNTLALTKSFVIPEFAKSFSWLTGPEAFYVQTLGQLKVCDYTAVLSSLKQYREIYQDRAIQLQSVAQSQSLEGFDLLEENFFKYGALSTKNLGQWAKGLPRVIVSDAKLRRQFAVEKKLKEESDRANALYRASVSEGTGKIGFQADLQKLSQSVELLRDQRKSERIQRLRDLAKMELNEISQILQKMHLVEAEVLSRAGMILSGAPVGSQNAEVKKGSTGSKDPFALRFPASREVWFDEISNYRVDANTSCSSMKK